MILKNTKPRKENQCEHDSENLKEETKSIHNEQLEPQHHPSIFDDSVKTSGKEEIVNEGHSSPLMTKTNSNGIKKDQSVNDSFNDTIESDSNVHTNISQPSCFNDSFTNDDQFNLSCEQNEQSNAVNNNSDSSRESNSNEHVKIRQPSFFDDSFDDQDISSARKIQSIVHDSSDTSVVYDSGVTDKDKNIAQPSSFNDSIESDSIVNTRSSQPSCFNDTNEDQVDISCEKNEQSKAVNDMSGSRESGSNEHMEISQPSSYDDSFTENNHLNVSNTKIDQPSDFNDSLDVTSETDTDINTVIRQPSFFDDSFTHDNRTSEAQDENAEVTKFDENLGIAEEVKSASERSPEPQTNNNLNTELNTLKTDVKEFLVDATSLPRNEKEIVDENSRKELYEAASHEKIYDSEKQLKSLEIMKKELFLCQTQTSDIGSYSTQNAYTPNLKTQQIDPSSAEPILPEELVRSQTGKNETLKASQNFVHSSNPDGSQKYKTENSFGKNIEALENLKTQLFQSQDNYNDKVSNLTQSQSIVYNTNLKTKRIVSNSQCKKIELPSTDNESQKSVSNSAMDCSDQDVNKKIVKLSLSSKNDGRSTMTKPEIINSDTDSLTDVTSLTESKVSESLEPDIIDLTQDSSPKRNSFTISQVNTDSEVALNASQLLTPLKKHRELKSLLKTPTKEISYAKPKTPNSVKFGGVHQG